MSDLGVAPSDRAVLSPSIQWAAIIGGTVVAAGISITLLAFGSAIGLAVASTAPTWRDSTAWLWFLSGVFLVFVALAAFGFGGYVTGRMREPMRLRTGAETEFRDGMHGVMTWGLAVLVTAFVTLAGAGLVASMAAPSESNAGAAQSVAGENIIAAELDKLFQTTDELGSDVTYRRAEAARILLKSSSHNGVPAADRDYLTSMVAAFTGISRDEAANRTDYAIQTSADEIHRARSAAVIQAFMIAAALLIGAAVAWFASVEGGRDREEEKVPVWNWSYRSRNVRNIPA
jgi:hypothetical protein